MVNRKCKAQTQLSKIYVVRGRLPRGEQTQDSRNFCCRVAVNETWILAHGFRWVAQETTILRQQPALTCRAPCVVRSALVEGEAKLRAPKMTSKCSEGGYLQQWQSPCKQKKTSPGVSPGWWKAITAECGKQRATQCGSRELSNHSVATRKCARASRSNKSENKSMLKSISSALRPPPIITGSAGPAPSPGDLRSSYREAALFFVYLLAPTRCSRHGSSTTVVW